MSDDENDQRVCHNCVGEAYLSESIAKNGVIALCDYCNDDEEPTITISELADEIEGAFDRHYERTSPDPDDFQSAMLRDKEIDYEWWREGEQVLWAIANAASVAEEVAQDVLDILEERHAVAASDYVGEEQEFDSDSYYEEKGANDYNFRMEWDAVELPSQFMENFCWEWDVLQHMTEHAETGAPLPRALYDKMIAAKNFQSGLQMLRQVEFSLFDMHLHYDYNPNGSQTVAELLADVRHRVAVIIPPAFNRFQHSFSHIFAGGYAAGYYSYKWAEVLSADAYGAFEEAQGDPNRLAETGIAFHREILSVGGSRPALESFTAFRGRAPNIDALLRHNGMVQAGT